MRIKQWKVIAEEQLTSHIEQASEDVSLVAGVYVPCIYRVRRSCRYYCECERVTRISPAVSDCMQINSKKKYKFFQWYALNIKCGS